MNVVHPSAARPDGPLIRLLHGPMAPSAGKDGDHALSADSNSTKPPAWKRRPDSSGSAACSRCTGRSGLGRFHSLDLLLGSASPSRRVLWPVPQPRFERDAREEAKPARASSFRQNLNGCGTLPESIRGPCAAFGSRPSMQAPGPPERGARRRSGKLVRDRGRALPPPCRRQCWQLWCR